MGHRSLLLAIAAFSSIHVAGADAQSVYVAPGGVYVGGGPVYVTPAPTPYAAPTYAPPPYAAPTYGYGYGPPAAAVPAPAIVAPTAVYGPNVGYYGAPVSAYVAELPPRPPAPVPYYGVGRCVYGGWPPC
jgi:hypothetical protein